MNKKKIIALLIVLLLCAACASDSDLDGLDEQTARGMRHLHAVQTATATVGEVGR